MYTLNLSNAKLYVAGLDKMPEGYENLPFATYLIVFNNGQAIFFSEDEFFQNFSTLQEYDQDEDERADNDISYLKSDLF